MKKSNIIAKKGMINIKNWCKGVLSLYIYLPTIADSIDKLVLNRALESGAYPMDTITTATSMINLTQYKIDLINLKNLTSETILSMDKAEAKLVANKYIDSNSVEDCIMLSGKPRRTYFRLLSKALRNFEIIFYSKLCKSKIFDNPPMNSFWEEMFSKVNRFSSDYDVSSCPQAVCSMILRKIRKIGVG